MNHAIGALVLMLFAPVALAQIAAGSQTIHRCIGANGEIVFSGFACTSGAAANKSGSVLMSPAPSASTGCPTSRDELNDRVNTAIARHDANAMAGLLRWQGVGARVANERLRSLRDLVKRPLLGIDGGEAVEAAPTTDSEMTDQSLRVRTGLDGMTNREHAFGVGVQGGCYWLIW